MEEKTWGVTLWNHSWNDLINDLENRRYSTQGTCQFSESKGAFLEIPFGGLGLTKKLQEDECCKEEMEETEYKHLYGFTEKGDYLVLNDVLLKERYSCSSRVYERLHANTALLSAHQFDPEAPIVAADFEIEGLLKWLSPKYHLDIQADEREVKCVKECITLMVYHSKKCAIVIRCGSKSGPNLNSVKILPHAEVHIDYTEGVSLDDFWEGELWKFQAFLAFCFGAYPAIQKARITLAGNGNQVDVYRRTTPTKKIKENFQCVPVPFPFIEDLSDVIARWMNMKDDELLSSKLFMFLMGHSKIPIHLLFFVATSMLESLARSKSKKLYTDEKLNSLINPMLDKADEKIRDRARELLRLLQRPSYRMLLDSAYDESGTWGKDIVPNWKKFRKEQGVLRNVGVHAPGSSEEYKKMVGHYYAQMLIAYVIFMKRLGLNEALEQFEKSSFFEVARQQIREHYPKPASQQ